MTKKIEIRLDRERMRNHVTVDDLLGILSGGFMETRRVLSHFVVGPDGDYMSEEDALKVIGKLTLAQLDEAGKDLFGKAEDVASPLENGGV